MKFESSSQSFSHLKTQDELDTRTLMNDKSMKVVFVRSSFKRFIVFVCALEFFYLGQTLFQIELLEPHPMPHKHDDKEIIPISEDSELKIWLWIYFGVLNILPTMCIFVCYFLTNNLVNLRSSSIFSSLTLAVIAQSIIRLIVFSIHYYFLLYGKDDTQRKYGELSSVHLHTDDHSLP